MFVMIIESPPIPLCVRQFDWFGGSPAMIHGDCLIENMIGANRLMNNVANWIAIATLQMMN